MMDLEVMARPAGKAKETRTPSKTRVACALTFLAFGSLAIFLTPHSLTSIPRVPHASAADPWICPVPFAVVGPSDGETMSAVAVIRIDHCINAINYITLEYDGIVLETAFVNGSTSELLLDTTLIPDS